MESEQGQLTNQDDIMAHIVQFYKQLFGGVEDRHIRLRPDFWSTDRKVSGANCQQLGKSLLHGGD